MVPYTNIILALLVILNTAQALPVAQNADDKTVDGIAIPVDETKEFKYELNRDHELQGSINGGQSGWALEQIAHGAKPQEIISGSRPKRQSDLEAISMPDHLEAPASTQGVYGRKKRMSDTQDGIEVIPRPIQGPVDHAYAQMISQSSNPEEVLLLAETIKRPKRQSETEATTEVSEAAEHAPIINDDYAKRLEGSAIYKALALAGGKRQKVEHAGGYGRRKRQSLAFEEEAILQEIFPINDDINEIEQTASLVIKPKIKSWGETGLVKNNQN